jgi:enoyl-CoA hydratase/carnithine racemase
MPGGPVIAEGSAFLYLRQFRKPVVGAVRGYALGGGWEVVQSCDVIIASENTRFGALEIRHGLFPFRCRLPGIWPRRRASIGRRG